MVTYPLDQAKKFLRFFREPGDGAIDAIVDFFAADVPDLLGIITFEQLGGAVGRVDERDTAFGHRRARHTFLVVRAWEDPVQSEENVAWGRRAYRVG